MSGHEMKQTRDGLLTIMNLEEERYSEVLRKGTNLIQQSLKSVDQSAEELPDELLFQLNDSHGLPPDMVINMARKSGWSYLRLRTGFSAEMAERHAKMAKAAAATSQQSSLVNQLPILPETVPLYYNDVQQRSFDASVLASFLLLTVGPEGQRMQSFFLNTVLTLMVEGTKWIMDRLQQTELRVKCWTHKKKRTLSFISAMARLKSGILFTGPLTGVGGSN